MEVSKTREEAKEVAYWRKNRQIEHAVMLIFSIEDAL
jgi:hypothetical protein